MKIEEIYGNSKGYQELLSLCKEVKEETDIGKVVSLLNSNEWVAIGAITDAKTNKTTFSLIRV